MNIAIKLAVLLSRGRELLTNWDFSNGTFAWVAQANTTLSETGGLMSVINVGAATAVATQVTATIPNRTYRITANLISTQGSGATLRVGTTVGTGGLHTSLPLSAGVYTTTFVATTDTSYVRLVNGVTTPLDGQTSVWDSVSVRKA